MEKSLNKKIETYITQFKDNIKNKIAELNFEEKSKVNEIFEFVYDYPRLTLDKDDFMKRKRVKNSIPNLNRCGACRANGEQCTRRRKTGYDFCGTHYKGAPHGLISTEKNNENTIKTMEVFSQDINGIIYYLDKMNNVYNITDIVQNKENPRIVAKYSKNKEGYYTITEFL
jgi:hypothetical protein